MCGKTSIVEGLFHEEGEKDTKRHNEKRHFRNIKTLNGKTCSFTHLDTGGFVFDPSPDNADHTAMLRGFIDGLPDRTPFWNGMNVKEGMTVRDSANAPRALLVLARATDLWNPGRPGLFWGWYPGSLRAKEMRKLTNLWRRIDDYEYVIGRRRMPTVFFLVSHLDKIPRRDFGLFRTLTQSTLYDAGAAYNTTYFFGSYVDEYARTGGFRKLLTWISHLND